MTGARALGTQNTSSAYAGGGFIFERPANGMHSARPQYLASRTAVNVTHRVISKGFITKDALVASVVGFAGYIAHVRCDSTRLTSHVVLTRAILVISTTFCTWQRVFFSC